MTCTACGQAEATVHLIEVVNGTKREVHLCPGCAEKKGVVIDPSILHVAAKQVAESLPGAVAELMDWVKAPAGSKKACPHCGATLEDLKATSRLGCPEDYHVFAEQLEPLLSRIHKTSNPPRHTGRVSERASARRRRHKKIEGLKAELDAAIASEDFELAAKLRDQLKCMDQAEPPAS